LEVGNATAGRAKGDNAQGGKADVGEVEVQISTTYQSRRKIVVGNSTGGEAVDMGSKGGDATVQKVEYIEGQSLEGEAGKSGKGDPTGGHNLGRHDEGAARGEDARYVYLKGRVSKKEATNVVRDNQLGEGQP
jgi:hypothetical protein